MNRGWGESGPDGLAEWLGFTGLSWITAGITLVGSGLLHFMVRDPSRLAASIPLPLRPETP